MRNPARILVVDDVADNVEILRMRLESLGYEVAVAMDGEQALQAVKADLPDLVLLDIMMPKIDGLEVVRRIKSDPTLPFIPVVL
ncbi:MAG: response regulator, partial [Reyranella sp.]|nr:response regulator [Reyranella sp.]